MKNQQFIILYISKFPILQQIWQHFTLTVNLESESFFLFVWFLSFVQILSLVERFVFSVKKGFQPTATFDDDHPLSS